MTTEPIAFGSDTALVIYRELVRSRRLANTGQAEPLSTVSLDQLLLLTAMRECGAASTGPITWDALSV